MHRPHGNGAKNSLPEGPLGPRFTPLHIDVVHRQCEVLSRRSAPPQVAGESGSDQVPFIGIADSLHRFLIQVLYLAATTTHAICSYTNNAALHQDIDTNTDSEQIAMQMTTSLDKYTLAAKNNLISCQTALLVRNSLYLILPSY